MQLYFYKVVEHSRGLGAETWTSTVEEFQQEQHDASYEGDGWWFFLSEEERDEAIKNYGHELEPIVDMTYDYDTHQWSYNTRP